MGPLAEMSGEIDPRLPTDFDRITDAYAQDEHRRDDTKHGRGDT